MVMNLQNVGASLADRVAQRNVRLFDTSSKAFALN
jgi:hypothetical protein